jgi:hypothetical protein
MRAGYSALLLAATLLVGCDRITGAADQKKYDAQAIGYACRVSLKVPEDCMKENESFSPTSILSGWRAADKDIHDQLIDPSMGKNAAVQPVEPAATEGAAKMAAEKTIEKPTGKTAADKSEKPGTSAKANAADKGKVAAH